MNMADYVVPATVALFLLMGIVKKVGVFDSFIEGANGGIKTIIAILPSLIGLITAVEMFKASGGLDILTAGLSPLTGILGIPAESVPMFILRPISGSGSIALLNHVLGEVGPDSFAGRVTAVMCGSSETTFYTITVYCGAVGIKKTRHVLAAALAADAAAGFASAAAVRVFF